MDLWKDNLIKHYQERGAIWGDEDFWEFNRQGKSIWIMTYAATLRCGFTPDPFGRTVRIHKPEYVLHKQDGLYGPEEVWMVQVDLVNEQHTVIDQFWGIGEVNAKNCKLANPHRMAIKRAIVHGIQQAIGLNQRAIYSEVEADDFERRVVVERKPRASKSSAPQDIPEPQPEQEEPVEDAGSNGHANALEPEQTGDDVLATKEEKNLVANSFLATWVKGCQAKDIEAKKKQAMDVMKKTAISCFGRQQVEMTVGQLRSLEEKLAALLPKT